MPGAIDLLAQRAAQHGAPMSATVVVTEKCNYECVHCYQDHVEDHELSFAEIERILRELADAGVLFLVLMGGEVFIPLRKSNREAAGLEGNEKVRVKLELDTSWGWLTIHLDEVSGDAGTLRLARDSGAK